jgi:hypothetical protein
MQQLTDAIAKPSKEIGTEVEPLAEKQDKKEVIEDFRQAWHEAMTGQTMPVSQLWEDLND